MPNRTLPAPGEGDCFFHVAAYFLWGDIQDEGAARRVRVAIAREAAKRLFKPPYDDLATLTDRVLNSSSADDLLDVQSTAGYAADLLRQRFTLGPGTDPGNGGGCPLPAFVVWLQYSAGEIADLRRGGGAQWLRDAHRFLSYTLWGDGAFSASLLQTVAGRRVNFYAPDHLEAAQLDPADINFVHSPNHFDAAVFEDEPVTRKGVPEHVFPDSAPFPSSDTVHLEIHHLDVGQGDGTLVLLKEGAKIVYSMLVDGGDAGSAELVHHYMAGAGVRALDCLVISHYDADHCNAAIELLSRSALCTATQVFDRGDAQDEYDTKAKDLETPFRHVMGGLSRGGAQVEIEDVRLFEDPVEELRHQLHAVARNRITAGLTGRQVVGRSLVEASGPDGPTFSILCVAANGYVLDGTYVTPLHNDRENTYSVCLLLRFNEFSYLLCGDATGVEGHDLEGAVAGCVTGTLGLKHVCAFKVSHHGSHHSTKPAYLAAIKPRAAFISAGVHRSHHHPRQEPIDALQADATIQNFYLSNCGYRRNHIERSGALQTGRARVAGDSHTLGTVVLRVDHSVARFHVFWVGYWDQEAQSWRVMRHCCVEPSAHEELFGVPEEEDDDLVILPCGRLAEPVSPIEESDEVDDEVDLEDPETCILAADECQMARASADEALVRYFGLREARPLRWQLDGTESAPPRELKTVETSEMRDELDARYEEEMALQEEKEDDDDSSFEPSFD